MARRLRCDGGVAIRPFLATALVSCLLSGCVATTQTPFERTATGAAGTLAAAAQTLRLHQQGRLTTAYARSSFVSFGESLAGVGDELPTLDGAPPRDAAVRLATQLRSVEPILRSACLASSGCDESAQARQLESVRDSLLEASGS